MRHLRLGLILAVACGGCAGARDAHETIDVFTDAPRAGWRVASWGMKMERRDGQIFLNEDHKGRPWAGLVFRPDAKGTVLLEMTKDWIGDGYLRFRINGLADPYGMGGPPCKFQVRLQGVGQRYLGLRERFLEGGKGIDDDTATWQEVHVSLKYLGAKPGDKIKAVTIQCWHKPSRAFAVDDVALVRLAEPPATDAESSKLQVAQPWVTWPEYDKLPTELQLAAIRPHYRNDAFVTEDGKRTFLITQWGHEHQKVGLGFGRDGRVVDNHGLYDPATQAFIYEQPLVGESMARLGFNCYAGQVWPLPFWRAIGYPGKHARSFEGHEFRAHVVPMKLPFYVDMVSFPWALGAPGTKRDTNLPPAALHDGDRHWTPYRIIGQGRDIWLTMWRTYAQRYKDAGAEVVFYEFMNEPAYGATTPDHRAEFVEWLKKRYGTLDRVNHTWRADYASWDAIRDFKKGDENIGLFFDYDEYLGDRMADLIAAGREVIESITPEVPAAVQSKGGYCLQPRDAIFHSKLIPRQRAVLTPTGGGSWSRHLGNAKPKPNTIEYGMSSAPIANDLLLAMAGTKMIVDNEMYLGPKQTRTDMRNRWWQSVITGLDGASWFAWSKRGWAWWKGKNNIMREADLSPNSSLIPYARRADAIRGTLEFAKEMALVREFVLPKPWGPDAQVGMIYSWANPRWRVWDKSLQDKSGDYHAAMKYLHWNVDMLPSHMADAPALARYRMLVAGGIDRVEPELVQHLTQFVRNGGILVAAESPMGLDLYGNAIDTKDLLGVEFGPKIEVAGALDLSRLPDVPQLPGNVTAGAGAAEITLLPGTEALVIDSAGKPMITHRSLGKGHVYVIAPDLIGYPLAKLLAAIRLHRNLPAVTEITDPTTSQLAPNILLSRRSYDSHHAFLLMNRDAFPKLMRLRVHDLQGTWQVSDPLTGRTFATANGSMAWQSAEIAKAGIVATMAAGAPSLILLTREPWTRSTVLAMTADDARKAYARERQVWEGEQTASAAAITVDPANVAYVDLRGIANATKDTVVKDAAARWVGFPFTEPLVRTFAGVPFQIIRWDHNAMKGYVSLRSSQTPEHPETVTATVGGKARRLFLLHTVGDGADNEKAGQCLVRYRDGSTAVMPLTVGDTVARLRDRVPPGPRLATSLTTGTGSSWHVAAWTNPKPNVEIASLELSSGANASGTFVLVAVTLEK